jgi:hypothetical protein
MKLNVKKCPECGSHLEEGNVNAQMAGILWFDKDVDPKWKSIFSKKVEKLQKDWWGFPKLSKESLPALRCRNCKIVVFKYNKEEC